jgi:lysine/ornithine N-monooxygenase
MGPLPKNKNKNKPNLDYLIIGFGASGIAAAIQLSLAKRSFKIIEKSSTFGGCWNQALPSSCLQTHRAFYKFATVDYDRGTSAFPNKLEVLNYFRKAIDIYKLFYHAEFNREASYKRFENHWVVTLKSNTTNTTIDLSCNHILVCTGLNQIPSIPKLFRNIGLAKMGTKIIHSSEFNKFVVKANNKFDKIVIVGNGASCCDILKYFNSSPGFDFQETEVKVFYRSDKYYVPTTVKGIPGSIFLTNFLLKILELVPKRIFIFFIIVANIFVFKSYLPPPDAKINSYNIVGSKIIQQLMERNAISYHREEIKDINLNKKMVKTNDAIYSGIDLIILATGYKEPDDNLLFNYVIPLNKENNQIGYIGFNRTYNFIENSESRVRWYIKNNHLLQTYKNEGVIDKWISKTQIRKKSNNLKFLDSTYELFELD